MKEADLEAQYQQTRVNAILARHGIRMDRATMQETPAQVRAFIKELFPKIPEDDLDQIMRHAWEEGSQRVGTNEMLTLPRRVQLATIARIRHTYTDYDFLLRAFDWKEARTQVEPVCLQKLIEWRGENDQDDNELEEIVRETIVLDDDDDEDASDDGRAEDDESAADLGETSDASVEVTHHLAGDEDLRAESAQEASNSFLRRQQPLQRTIEERNDIARQRIGAVRQQMRNDRSPPPP